MSDEEFERYAGIRRTFKAPGKIEDMLDYMEASIKMDLSTKLKIMPCMKTMANRKFTVDKQFIHGFSALAHDEKISEYGDLVQFLNAYINERRVTMPEAPPSQTHNYDAYFQQPSMVILKKWVSEPIRIDTRSACISGQSDTFDLHQYFVRRSGNKKPSFVLEAFRDNIKKSVRIGFDDDSTFSNCDRVVRTLACRAHREVLMDDLRAAGNVIQNTMAGSLMPGAVMTSTVRASQLPAGSFVQGSMIGRQPLPVPLQGGSMIRSSTVPAHMSRVNVGQPPPSASRLVMQNQSQIRHLSPEPVPIARTSVVGHPMAPPPMMPPPIPPPQVMNAIAGSMARPGMGGSIINQLNVSRFPQNPPHMNLHETPDKIPMPLPGQAPIPPGRASSDLLKKAQQSVPPNIRPPSPTNFQPAPFQPPPMKAPAPPPMQRPFQPPSRPPPTVERKQSIILNHHDSLDKNIRMSKLNSSKLNKTIVHELLDPESEDDVMEKIETQNNILEEPNFRGPDDEVEEVRLKKDYDIFHCIVPEFELGDLFDMSQYNEVKEGPGYSIYESQSNRKNMKLLLRLQHPRDLVLSALIDPANYKYWNEQVELGNIKLRIYSQNSVIAYQKHKAFNQFYRQRDFLYIRHLFKKDNIIYMVDKSIQHSNFPPFSYITRGDIKIALWGFKQQNPNLTTLTYMIETNFKGHIGGTKVVELTMKYLEEMSKLDNYLRDMQPVPVTTKIRDYFDIDWDLSRNEQNRIDEEFRKNKGSYDAEITMRDVPEELYRTALPEIGWYDTTDDMSFQPAFKGTENDFGFNKRPAVPTPKPALVIPPPSRLPVTLEQKDSLGEKLQAEVGKKLSRRDTIDQHFGATMGNLLSRPDADIHMPIVQVAPIVPVVPVAHPMMHQVMPLSKISEVSKSSLTSKLHNELIDAYNQSTVKYQTSSQSVIKTHNISAEIAQAEARKASELKAHLNLEQAALRNRQLQQYDFINGKPVRPLREPSKKEQQQKEGDKNQLPPIPFKQPPPKEKTEMTEHPMFPHSEPPPPVPRQQLSMPPVPPPALQASIHQGNLLPGTHPMIPPPSASRVMISDIKMQPPLGPPHPPGLPIPPSSVHMPPQMPPHPPAGSFVHVSQAGSNMQPHTGSMPHPIMKQPEAQMDPRFMPNQQMQHPNQPMHPPGMPPGPPPQYASNVAHQSQLRMPAPQQQQPRTLGPQPTPHHERQHQHYDSHGELPSHANPPDQPYVNRTAQQIAQVKSVTSSTQPSMNSTQQPSRMPPRPSQQMPPQSQSKIPTQSSKNQLIPPAVSKKQIYTSDEDQRPEITRPDQKHIFVDVPVQLNPKTGLCVLPQDYLRVRHAVKPVPSNYTKLSNPKWRNYYLRDIWEVNSTGELKCVNEEKLKEQHSIMSYVVNKMAANLFTGKSILNVSLPVSIFSQMSVLELTAKGFGFAPLFLQRAAKQANPLQRLKLAMAFSVGYSLLYLQMQKPFNPILGETFQGWLNGCPVVCQQISHHPAISAFFMTGRGYKIYGNVQAKINLSMNSGVGSNDGEYVIEFDQWPRNKIRIRSPGGEILGLTFGERKFTLTGKSYYFDEADSLFCEVAWNPYKKGMLSFGKQSKPSDTMEGPIVKTTPQFIRKFRAMQKKQGPGKKQILQTVGNVSGRWTQALKIDGVEYLNTQRDQPCALEQEKYPLNSNSNYREDIIYRRKKDIARAQVEKERLEVLQREDKKLRQRRPGYKAH